MPVILYIAHSYSTIYITHSWLLEKDRFPHIFVILGHQSMKINPFGAIGDYNRPLVDRYCRLWSTYHPVMTSLRLHLNIVSLNCYKVKSVFIESTRTPGGVSRRFAFLALHFVKFAMIF